MKSGEDLETLFLLEFLVDNVQLDWSKIDLDKDVLSTLKQTCVRFQFLNYPILEVCEEDFCETNGNQEESSLVVFKCGKSCLFSLRSLTPELRCFFIRATVLRKKDSPPHHLLGKACINLGESFANVINSVLTGNDDGPVTETVKDVYSIVIPSGTEIGKLTLFIRLSCFGKMIITQFQITDEEKKTFFFKGDETRIMAALGDGPSGSTTNFSIKQAPFSGDEGRFPISGNVPCGSTILSSIPSRGPGMTDGFTHLGKSGNFNPFGMDQQPSYGMMQTPSQGPGMTDGFTHLGQSANFAPFGMDQQPSYGMMQTPSQGPGMTDGFTHLGQSVNFAPFGMDQQPSFGMMQTPPQGPGMTDGFTHLGQSAIFTPFGMDQQPSFGMIQPPSYAAFSPMPRRPEDLLGGAGGLLGGSPFGDFGNDFMNFPGPPPMGLLGGNPEVLSGPQPVYAQMGFGQTIPTKKRKQKYPNFPFCGGIPRVDDSSSSDDEEPIPPPPPPSPPLNLCECDFPLPPSFGMQCPPPPPPKKKKKKKKKNTCPLELAANYCMKSDCPMGYPTLGGMETTQCTQMQMPPNAIALKEDQVIFQIPPYMQPNYPGGFSSKWNPTDMFSMKVGRRVNAHDQNTKVELQFEPPPKKNVCRLDVETQYVPGDFGGTVDGGEKKGKGKGKKGKGKKK